MTQIATARWYHDRIIDMILASEVPLSQNEIAKTIGYSATWVSIMVNSDAFKERLAQRKAELTDPIIAASINERLDALAKTTLDRLIKRVDVSGDTLPTKDLVSIAKLAVGDKNTRPAAPPTQNNLYVVSIPPAAGSSSEWLKSAQGATPRGDVSDAKIVEGALLPAPQPIPIEEIYPPAPPPPVDAFSAFFG